MNIRTYISGDGYYLIFMIRTYIAHKIYMHLKKISNFMVFSYVCSLTNNVQLGLKIGQDTTLRMYVRMAVNIHTYCTHTNAFTR